MEPDVFAPEPLKPSEPPKPLEPPKPPGLPKPLVITDADEGAPQEPLTNI